MIETTTLYTRSETVLQLNLRLGMDYDWHHALMMWTAKKNAHASIRSSGIKLFPHCTHKRSPLYLPADIARFIVEMRAKFPEMGMPFKFAPSRYDVETSPLPKFVTGTAHKLRKAKPALPAATA